VSDSFKTDAGPPIYLPHDDNSKRAVGRLDGCRSGVPSTARRISNHENVGNIKILFVAGFGPIVRDRDASRRPYAETFDIPFKEDEAGYLHTVALKGVKHFALWPLSQAARSCFGKDSWPREIPVPQA
jgi:hypothetical protein